jgi:hypothetical protein
MSEQYFFVALLVRGKLRLLFDDECDCPFQLFSVHLCPPFLIYSVGVGGSPVIVEIELPRTGLELCRNWAGGQPSAV